ncbi:uncharacterized protein LOC129297976 [Prosopis cineraria]|uniref:uncharacterized protein LOC129297976 n=1 Tax=Prosopis cineraria TaxID=364024 RepID=UPI002410598A|nr:uncharacterized protein LOC129297976 [Prosopis cineraria]
MESIYHNPLIRRRRNFKFSLSVSDVLHQRQHCLRHSHNLRLLHRSDATFFVLEPPTGNVYTVVLSTVSGCTCPDLYTPCNHILFVIFGVLGVSLADVGLHIGTLLPSRVRCLVDLPTMPGTEAAAELRLRFYELLAALKLKRHQERRRSNNNVEVEDGTSCPICLEEMKKEDKFIVACATCRNPIHEECLEQWTRSSNNNGSINSSSSPSCVICRAPWWNMNEDKDEDVARTILNLYA